MEIYLSLSKTSNVVIYKCSIDDNSVCGHICSSPLNFPFVYFINPQFFEQLFRGNFLTNFAEIYPHKFKFPFFRFIFFI